MLALVLPFSSMDAVHEFVKAQLILPKKNTHGIHLLIIKHSTCIFYIRITD